MSLTVQGNIWRRLTIIPKPAFRAIIIGAGERGRCYARSLQHTRAAVAAVADPIAYKRTSLGQSYIWHDSEPRPGQEFEGWQDFLQYEKARRQRESIGEPTEPGIDAAFICVQDSDHAEVIVALAPLCLHLFSEKPLATTMRDCLDIYAALLQDGHNSSPKHIFSIGHVLRYSPHNKQLRRMVLEDRCIGDILSIEHTEPVGYWHFSHSYVRGNWRKESTSAPSLLAKSCHDIDFLLWLLCSPTSPTSSEPPHHPTTISSSGHLGVFKRSRKPAAAGTATNCLSCPAEPDCLYSAKRIYLEKQFHPKSAHNWPWPISVVRPDIEDLYHNKGSDAARGVLLDELSKDYDAAYTPTKDIESRNWFGRCVWEADNDVCDDQTVTMTWEDDILPEYPHRLAKSATFHMIASTQDQCIRRGRIYGTEGEIVYDSKTIVVHYFGSGTSEKFDIKQRGGGHGDGDDGLTEQFAAAVEAVKTGSMGVEAAQNTFIGCSLDEIIRSHAVVFAAEEARTRRTVIDWADWRKQEVESKLMAHSGWELVSGQRVPRQQLT